MPRIMQSFVMNKVFMECEESLKPIKMLRYSRIGGKEDTLRSGSKIVVVERTGNRDQTNSRPGEDLRVEKGFALAK